jgi:hypothetical protein
MICMKEPLILVPLFLLCIFYGAAIHPVDISFFRSAAFIQFDFVIVH